MKIDTKIFEKYIEDKLISVRKHPEADLYIYNYTHKAQFAGEWDEILKMARGLILDGEGNIIARPFPKFFNLAEHTDKDSLENVPDELYKVWEKLDGSLGILYWHNTDMYVATRGSFESEQALEGTKILREKYPDIFFADGGITYLFEIIYPENRIVVNYDNKRDLVLLAAIDNATGKDRWDLFDRMASLGVSVAESNVVLPKSPQELRESTAENSEGYVIQFKGGLRMKVKFDEYVRLHRLVTGVNARRIWDLLRNEESFDELLERVPDEFYKWVKDTKKDLLKQFEDIARETAKDCLLITEDINFIYGDGSPGLSYKDIATKYRKEFAEKAVKCKYPALLFVALDSKPVDPLIWKLLKPKAEVPFKEEI